MFFNTKGLSIYYEKYGSSNKTILILPGWGKTRETFQNIIRYFQEDYTIYIMDYPGFGKSKIPKKTLTIYDYAAAIRNFMRKNHIINPIIIAHSFGGRIATLLSSYYQEPIEKMILIDIAGIKSKKRLKQYCKEKIYKLLKRLVSHLKNKDKLQKKLLKIFGSSDYQNLPNGMHQTFKNIINEDLTNYFRYINSECLLIWGELDADTPLKDGYKLNKLIKDSALIIYPKANHFPYLQQPFLTNQIIKEFLKKN